MKHIIGKTIILIFCLCLSIYFYPINVYSILALLSAIICGFASYILLPADEVQNTSIHISKEKSLLFSEIIIILYIIISLFCPTFIAFLPLVGYDIGNLKYKVAPFTIIAIYIYYLYADRSILLAASFLLLLCSIYLAYICELNIMQEKNIIRQRDTSVEHELLIEENNRQIIANQDATIYMATLKERNRIAREIHDNVGHMLTRSILQVGALKTLNNDEKLIEPITNLQSTLNSAMTSIRTSVHDLHDDSIDLKSSIEALANDVSRLKVIVDYDMTENIPRDIKYSFITITKEAINNAEKYSNGDTITVLLREHPGFYQLMISDNGTDIDIKDTGIGLTGMRDRVAALNGTIKITTTDGFNILVSVMKRS